MQALQKHIEKKQAHNDILLMSHVVMGYPSFSLNKVTAKEYSNAGVELVELQFPFSEPIADGPTLMKANQESLRSGTSIDDCFRVAEEITTENPDTGFVIMTYYNIIYQMGERKFIQRASEAGIIGLIIPDLPPENATTLKPICDESDISLINLVTPKTPDKRLDTICEGAKGMVYCVARSGVSGYPTLFAPEFEVYINKIKKRSPVPIGVGFGVQSKDDVEYLKGKVSVAIVCSKAVSIAIEDSPKASANYLSSLR